MQDNQVFQVRLNELESDITEAIRVVAGYLALMWCKPCLNNTKHFAFWMIDLSCIFKVLSCDNLVAYSAHLGEAYAKLAASRMWAVVSCLVDEAVELQQLPSNHIKCIHGFKACDDENLHGPMKLEETRALLKFIDDGITQSKRDHTLFILLLRSNIRYKREFARLSHEVKQVSDIYLEAVELNEA